MPTQSIRRPSPSRIRRTVRAAVSLAVVLGLTGGSVAASGAVVDRQIVVDDVEIEQTVNPCTGVPGTFARTFNGVIQTVMRPDGSTLFRGNIRADDATFTPDDPSQPTFTGRETVKVNEVTRGTSVTSTFVLHFRSTGTDGSRSYFRLLQHITTNANGKVSFSKAKAVC